MKKELTNAPSGNPLGVTSDAGTKTAGTAPSFSTTKAGVLGYILGLATAGILYIVTRGNGKRSKGSRSASPMPEGELTLLPPADLPVDVKGHDNDGCTAEEPVVNHHAPAGVAKRKLTDEEVALIRAWESDGVPAKEIAARLGISVKTVYARRKKQNSNPVNPKQDEQ